MSGAAQLALSVSAPSRIRGREGGPCSFLEGKVGHLVEDRDTATLVEMGLAYYEFDAYRGSVIVCYSLDEATTLASSEGQSDG